jgi:hypothetical protein
VKTRKHIELFGLIKGKVATGIHIFSRAGPTDRWL